METDYTKLEVMEFQNVINSCSALGKEGHVYEN
jgi:hypothetical protein